MHKVVTATPCGQLPILDYNGTALAQSVSVARFLAKECNLAGKTRLEEGQADMVVDCVGDVLGSK
jgi:glutathione S-transferase